jgi:hypothetical protein
MWINTSNHTFELKAMGSLCRMRWRSWNTTACFSGTLEQSMQLQPWQYTPDVQQQQQQQQQQHVRRELRQLRLGAAGRQHPGWVSTCRQLTAARILHPLARWRDLAPGQNMSATFMVKDTRYTGVESTRHPVCPITAVCTCSGILGLLLQC